jgi:mannose-1-phosphate guanylyltransferase
MLPRGNVIVQPSNRDTGPGPLFGLLRLAWRYPAAVIAVFPSDHYVRDDLAFLGHLDRATRVVRRLPDKIVLLGIEPDRPEPGLGYIETGEAVGLVDDCSTFHVAAFHEKPSAEAAKAIIARGGLWNSFVMVFCLGRVLELLRNKRRADCEQMERGATAYRALPSWNFSHDFLARVPEDLIAMRVENIGWSDWGTPESIERTFALLNRHPPWRPRPLTGAAA